MAHNFNYDTPDDFSKDEEKWLKFFSMKALLSTIIFAVIGALIFFPIFKFFGKIHIGIIITIIFGAIGYAVVSFEIPVTTELPGAGHTPLTILFRIFLRKLPRNRIIYTKGYGEYENFEEDDGFDEEVYADSKINRLRNGIQSMFR